jgi:hypothetical protein
LPIYLSPLAVGEVIEPFAFEVKLMCGELSLTVSLVGLYLPSIKCATIVNVNSLLTLSISQFETSLIH